MIYHTRDRAAPDSPPDRMIGSDMGEGVMARFAERLITLGLILFGLVLMVTPLALWVAWTDTVFFVVLATGVAAGALYCVLVLFERPADSGRGGLSSHARAKNLPDKIIAELQELHPFIHHHRSSGGPKFRSVMHRLKERLYRGPG